MFRTLFNMLTRFMGYGIAVTLSSILWSGLISIINLIYLIPILYPYFDFSPMFYMILRICFILPFPTAAILYGAFTRLGIPAALPSFRVANKYITVVDGELQIQQDLSREKYQDLLGALNRIPILFFWVATIEVAYIDILVIIYSITEQYTASSFGIILFSWLAQTTIYAGVGYVLSELVTGRMRESCKKIVRRFSVNHEIETRPRLKYKMLLIGALFFQVTFLSVLMTYVRREAFGEVLIYLGIFVSIISFLGYLIARGFMQALYNIGSVVEDLKERGEGIIYTTTLDRELVDLAVGINSASDTITDYRQNLEEKVEQRTRELSNAKEEIEAAMSEVEVVNENLIEVNRKLEDSNIQFQQDMDMAATVQAAFLPQKLPLSDQYDIAMIFKPVSGVSGDFFDFYQEKGELEGAGIFDVSGHGISSGLLTVLARSIIENCFKNHKHEKLSRLMDIINSSLIDEIDNTGLFITGILLRFKGPIVEYANSAHPHMLYRTARTNKVGAVMPANGESIVGPFMGMQIMNKEYRTLSVKFNPGDCLLIFTDSLSETKNSDGIQYEESRILQSLGKAPDSTAREMLDHVMGEFYNFIQKDRDFGDDLTVMLIKKK